MRAGELGHDQSAAALGADQTPEDGVSDAGHGRKDSRGPNFDVANFEALGEHADYILTCDCVSGRTADGSGSRMKPDGGSSLRRSNALEKPRLRAGAPTQRQIERKPEFGIDETIGGGWYRRDRRCACPQRRAGLLRGSRTAREQQYDRPEQAQTSFKRAETPSNLHEATLDSPA